MRFLLSMAFWRQSRVKLSLFITLAMLLGVSGTVYAAAASDETQPVVPSGIIFPTPEEEEALIYGRNANWAKQMPDIMKQASTLFVVGAGHLPGEHGVLKLLEKQGYTVEAMN